MQVPRSDWDSRVAAIQDAVPSAYERLLVEAERGGDAQSHRIANFIAATHGRVTSHFSLMDLSALDVGMSDDVLLCIDAIRWGMPELHLLVPDGLRRVEAICDALQASLIDEACVNPRR